ncbi:LytTR family DNA-binding domain-containing protein [Runella sp.]|jgi:DNA-binding LytR/AlgR family response regulator|uniref:LytTR family DNA-binding domain-containing protein n=1 Tax=Runella sp. TaxID=1960881 RepID=UPI0030172EE5
MTAVSNPITGLSACLSLLGGHYQLLFEEIVFIEGQGNYTVFHSRHGQPILTSKSLSFYRDKLPAQLMRVHKSYFVNTHFVKSHDRALIYLSNGSRIPISRRRRREVHKTIHVQSPF